MDYIKIKGSFELSLSRNGKVVENRKMDNIVTNAGIAQIALLVGDSSAVPFTYLALGIGTTAANATDTQLDSEITDTGLERSSATVSRVTTTVTNDTLLLSKSWTATGEKAVTEIGAFNDSSAGTILGHQVFSVINTDVGDVLTLNYKFKFA